MSAFLVSHNHISTMLSAGMSHHHPLSWYWPDYNAIQSHESGQPWGPAHVAVLQETQNKLTLDTADRVGQMLLSENHKSVNHRYSESDDESRLYRYSPRLQRPAVEILKLIDCYEYQSCEHPGWKKSEARKFCDVLRGKLIGQLPGYSDAKWSI